jgi:hypothetical protein
LRILDADRTFPSTSIKKKKNHSDISHTFTSLRLLLYTRRQLQRDAPIGQVVISLDDHSSAASGHSGVAKPVEEWRPLSEVTEFTSSVFAVPGAPVQDGGQEVGGSLRFKLQIMVRFFFFFFLIPIGCKCSPLSFF